mmetsp:Transcript_15076/g.36382  ORF Transcript_15076/g.36382 Transcript_15076/m.36382 type:complete len:309 (+) Transcript_15076:210-1136(+)
MRRRLLRGRCRIATARWLLGLVLGTIALSFIRNLKCVTVRGQLMQLARALQEILRLQHVQVNSMLGQRKPDSRFSTSPTDQIVHCVVLLQERITQNHQRPCGRRNIQSHHCQLASAVSLHLDIVRASEIKASAINHEPQSRKSLGVGTIGVDPKLAFQAIDDGSRPGNQAGSAVNRHFAPAVMASAQASSVHSHICHWYLPILLSVDINPMDLRPHSVPVVGAKSDLTVTCVGPAQKHREQVVLEHALVHHVRKHIKLAALRHGWQRQPQDAIEWRVAKRVLGLLGSADETGFRTQRSHAQAITHVHS